MDKKILFSSYIDIWMNHGGELIGMVEQSEGFVLPGTENVPTVGKQGSFSRGLGLFCDDHTQAPSRPGHGSGPLDFPS